MKQFQAVMQKRNISEVWIISSLLFCTLVMFAEATAVCEKNKQKTPKQNKTKKT